jgi:hypothetical protein
MVSCWIITNLDRVKYSEIRSGLAAGVLVGALDLPGYGPTIARQSHEAAVKMSPLRGWTSPSDGMVYMHGLEPCALRD